jgi:double-stranded uracil-DNA glycosylase
MTSFPRRSLSIVVMLGESGWMPRPTPQELAAGYGRTIPDLIAPDLKVLFVGINPGLWSAAVGRHFGNPANRLWPTLHAAGFTPRRFLPSDADELLALGYGITNLVARATGSAGELHDDELRAGAPVLVEKIERYRPRAVAFLGLSAYRIGFGKPRAPVGRQDEPLGGAPVWLLPNPSGLNAHYQMPDLVRLYLQLRVGVGLAAQNGPDHGGEGPADEAEADQWGEQAAGPDRVAAGEEAVE